MSFRCRAFDGAGQGVVVAVSDELIQADPVIGGNIACIESADIEFQLPATVDR